MLSLEAAAPQVGVGGSTTVSESFTNVGVSDVKKLRLTLSACARLAGQAARPRRRPAAQARAAVHGRLSRDRAAVRSAARVLDLHRRGVVRPARRPAHVLGEARRVGLLAGARAALDGRRDHAPRPRSARPAGPSRSARGGWGCSTRRSARRRPTPTRRSTGARVSALVHRAGHRHRRSGRRNLGRRRADRARRHDRGKQLARRRRAVRERQRDDRAWPGTPSAARDVDSATSRFRSVTATAPVGLRLVRRGSTYAGYYSTDPGKTWNPVGTVTVAASASHGRQDVGVFHASGLSTWTTTATFRDFRVR